MPDTIDSAPAHLFTRTPVTDFMQPTTRLWRFAFGALVLIVLALSLLPIGPEVPSTGWDKTNHLLAFSMYIGLPFGNILGPLIIWQLKKGESEYVDYHGRESLNFQISATI